MSRRPTSKALLRLAVVVGIAGAVVAALLGADGSAPARAADLSQFKAGDIISDAFFFDGNAMNAADVQRFLDLKGTACSTGSDGSPCLRVYRQDTPSQPADAMCGAYQGVAQETAASIITRVGQACGISQRAILVMLQKEEGLVTISSPTWGRYKSAMGMGCPDTAACNSQYAWFFQQVYGAAHQFKRYAVYPGSYGYKAGMTNQIRWSPTASCGSGAVFIYNQATAGLYNYTPYQPNRAALAAGYGTGDACSAYGNRNFYSYYTDWFGSTHEPGAAQISGAYYQMGPGVLGAPTGAPACGLAQGGCKQYFDGGVIYWSPASGAHVVRAAVLDSWTAAGRETGILGYPLSDELVTADGVGRVQAFQGGNIFWSPSSGAHPVRAAILASWAKNGADTGVLRYPVSDELVTADGVGRVQAFQGGNIFWSPSSGAHPVRAAILASWAATGADTGYLHYPTGDETSAADGAGRLQTFQGGTILWSSATGGNPVHGAVLEAYTRNGADNGTLGLPLGPELAAANGAGVTQQFQGGTVYWTSATGAHPVTARLADGLASRGGSSGPLGLPLSDPQTLSGGAGLVQTFQGGLLFAPGTSGTVSVQAPVLAVYQAMKAQSGPLGLPLSDEADAGSGVRVQQFQSGAVYSSTSGGAHAVRGAIGYAWADAGGLTGQLGYPTGDETVIGTGRVAQQFSGGTVYWSSATYAHPVSGAIAASYTAAGGPAGALQLPIGDETDAVGGGRVQPFQSGSIYWSSGGGAHPVRGAIGYAWQDAGAVSGPLGYPTSDETVAGPGSVVQHFTGGSIYWSHATGAHVLSGAIATAYGVSGGATGPLGLPVGEETPAGGAARVQQFQSGSIYWAGTGAAHPVRAAVADAWLAGGGTNGPLGWPTSDETVAGPGRVVQHFQNGSIYWSYGTGAHSVRVPYDTEYTAVGGPSGVLGLPVGEDTAVAGSARVQTFQGGWIYWTSAGGAHTVRGAISVAWGAAGGMTGSLGYPKSDETVLGRGSYQQFSGGILYWTPVSGVHRMVAPILDAWKTAGGPTGSLGEPVGDVRTQSGGQWQDFQHGHILVLPGQTAQVVVS